MDEITTMVEVATTPSNKMAGTNTTWGIRHQGGSAARGVGVEGVWLQ